MAAPWGPTHRYVFWSPQARYLNVLDPVFMAIPFPAAFQLQHDMFQGQEPDVPGAVAGALDSDHLAFPANVDEYPVRRRLRDDPRVRLIYEGDDVLYALVPGANRGFVIDWSFQPDLDRRRVDTLATCSWIRSQETVLMQGPPGVGKTHLAVALGVRAIESGFSVGFYHLDDLMHDLKQDAEVPPTRVKGKKYLRNAHHYLILHGRYTCIARRPKCEECAVRDLCPSRDLFI